MSIRTIIREEALRRGPISFARFMELALYCPNLGYYEQLDVSPGRKGDYFTSVATGSLFGELLAYQLAQWLHRVPARPWQILEAGAHGGMLAGDILTSLQTYQPDVSKFLEYWILEPSPQRRDCQRKTLAEFAGRIRWFDSWSALPSSGVNGFIVTNELLDAMPVHRIGWDAKQQEWFEWGVTTGKDHEFMWERMPENSTGQIKPPTPDLPRELLDVLPDGFITEVCPLALEWWGNAAYALKSGKLLTFDYGLMSEEFLAPERSQGTLRAYFKHHQSPELLARPGEQDLTAHVNFTAIRAAGERAGLRTESLVTQAQFLTGIVAQMSRDGTLSNLWSSDQVRQFQTLTHPEHLGNSFRVLVQSR